MKPGRPRKITAHIARKIFLMAGYGMTDEQIAEVLGICRDTISVAKKDVEFSYTMAKCKEAADLKVMNALYHRAVGYSHPEEKIFQYEGTPVVVPTVKHYPPDTDACKTWLFCRRPAEWKPPKAVDPVPDPAEAEKTNNRTLIQIFHPVKQKELSRIAAGEDALDVLFSPAFKQKMERKQNGAHGAPNAPGSA